MTDGEMWIDGNAEKNGMKYRRKKNTGIKAIKLWVLWSYDNG